ncbi:MAG: hypothetical protein RIS88_1214 [Pseudomonadota bacterium]|jgi:hypothetical protein
MSCASPIAPSALQPGVTLRHYKGGLYRVVGLCRIEATLKTGVLYQACQGDEEVVWMRPLAEFGDVVTTPDGTVMRFTVVTAR